MTTQPAPASTPRVGPYELLTRIGEGGMGVVHLARDPRGRRVALKVLRPHVVGDQEARERLAREVSSLRRISSPRIAEILDADPHGPVPYVVTRYVPGLSLYHHLQEEGPIEGDDLLHCADALAEALQAVHAVGVLHRDVKPSNVLMEGRSPVLIDFGLARVAEDSPLTQTGWLLGTPGYLAPEILYGDPPTPAADVHAWAATVVFAATGRAPYGTGPAMAVMDRVRRGQHELGGVPDRLRERLGAALAPDPLDRPTLDELRDWLREERELRHLTRGAGGGAADWTMPYAPAAAGAALRAGANGTVVETEPTTQVVPLPNEEPPVIAPALPPAGDAYDAPWDEPYDGPIAPAPRAPSRAQRTAALLGLGVLTAGVVGYAPYLGTAVVGVVTMLLRAASVTAERHRRRQIVRGRPRWYDVPATTLSTPGYLVIALAGTVVDLLLAGLVALAGFSVGYLAGQPIEVSLLLGGLGFVPGLWWSPTSARVRQTTRGLAGRAATTEYGGWLVGALGLLGGAALLALVLGSGTVWAPALGPPWR